MLVSAFILSEADFLPLNLFYRGNAKGILIAVFSARGVWSLFSAVRMSSESFGFVGWGLEGNDKQLGWLLFKSVRILAPSGVCKNVTSCH